MNGKIQKISLIKGENLYFRDAKIDDADFIFNLRHDIKKSRYISATSNNITDQIDWLKKYKSDNSQAYFIILDKQKNPVGTVRIYDQQYDSFCWGSWILQSGASISYAIESVLMVYEYGLKLGFKNAHFDVKKENKSVWRFHERFGAQRVGQSEEDYYYKIGFNAIQLSLTKYKDYLPNGIEIP